ncbi:16S rRNA (guanine(966)-N(2))-methyltransferase RsmD [Trichlorobacter ammonificans]|uniref:Methyltransferase n=1 Tax=Trichlorobacter ammonificans TaxID=2916410 RepID=A0ABM9D7K3_9BACT|nr:16S rRNA (guanine(966)-N(2))-methyltransferase RsmD [Trichlorobacter ammonificans]CAH2031146.1 Methyltransferase [Trichlorobacter ammonificans]
MRVISGRAGGLKLTAPRGTTTRPTTDRVKEALFNILEHAGLLEAAHVLDLFAGSGALGIEALSRGSASCVFVEKNRPALEALQANLSRTGCDTDATVLRQDALRAIERLADDGRRFTLALLDPPYDSGLQTTILEQVADRLMEPGGTLVMETDSRSQLPERIGSCTLHDRRVYGDTAILFFTTEARHAP